MKSERDPLDVAIGAELRKRRLAASISLEQMGRAIGVTYQQVQKYETGANRIAMATGVRLAEALGCAPADLFSAVSKQAEGAPPFPSARELKLADRVGRLPDAQRYAVHRIVDAIFESSQNRRELVEIARDGHPALSYAH